MIISQKRTCSECKAMKPIVDTDDCRVTFECDLGYSVESVDGRLGKPKEPCPKPLTYEERDIALKKYMKGVIVPSMSMDSEPMILSIYFYEDGDNWCARVGPNLQEGRSGFGDTPMKALRALVDDIGHDGWSLPAGSGNLNKYPGEKLQDERG
jgi:hypothetical protein